MLQAAQECRAAKFSCRISIEAPASRWHTPWLRLLVRRTHRATVSSAAGRPLPMCAGAPRQICGDHALRAYLPSSKSEKRGGGIPPPQGSAICPASSRITEQGHALTGRGSLRLGHPCSLPRHRSVGLLGPTGLQACAFPPCHIVLTQLVLTPGPQPGPEPSRPPRPCVDGVPWPYFPRPGPCGAWQVSSSRRRLSGWLLQGVPIPSSISPGGRSRRLPPPSWPVSSRGALRT